MDREILFRGKRTDNGEWVEGFFFCMVHDDGSHVHHFVMPLGADLSLGTPIEKIQVEVYPETVCQYTGLTDKNGRKIFEGDICDRKEEFPEIVTYHNGDWTLDYSYASGKESGYNYSNLGFYAKERGGVKIIGNIFDNPELLEGGTG